MSQPGEFLHSCELCDLPGELRCGFDGLFFCREHGNMHSSKKGPSHILHDLAADENWELMFCTLHREQYVFFCENDKQLLCRTCIVKHSGHQMVDIDEGVRMEKENSLQTWMDIAPLEAQIHQTIAAISDSEALVDIEFDKAQSEITGFINQLLAEVEICKESLENNLLALTKSRSQALKQQRSRLERYVELLRNCQTNWDDCIQKKLLSKAVENSSTAAKLLLELQQNDCISLLQEPKPFNLEVNTKTIPDFAQLASVSLIEDFGLEVKEEGNADLVKPNLKTLSKAHRDLRSVILDVRPLSDETDMKALENCVREIRMDDGLVRWGVSELVSIAFGLKMLRIAVILDDEILSTDDLREAVEAKEEFVKSTDVFVSMLI
jgi:translation elongation factor EF-1beta